VLPVLADHDALQDLRQLLHLAIDLRRADADAAGVQHRVGAAVDDDAAMLGQLHIVAVMPDVGIALEIGGAIAFAVGIIPESDRHRRKWRRADQLTLLALDRFALVVPDLDLHAEAAHLDLAAPDRAGRV